MTRRFVLITLLASLSSCGGSSGSSTAELLEHCRSTATLLLSSDVGDVQEAEEAARSCTSLLDRQLDAGDRANVTLYQGVVFDYLGRQNEALASFRSASELAPSSSLATYRLGVALLNRARQLELEGEREQASAVYAEAIGLLQKIAPIADAEPDRYGYLALALWSIARYDEAIAAYKEDIQLNAADRRRRISLAWNLNYLGRHGEALAVFEEAKLVTPLRESEQDSEMTREIREASERDERWSGWDNATKFER